MDGNRTVWVRGAGELGSATAVVLHRTGFRVLLSERAEPLAIRRTVCFSDAVVNGKAQVEGIEARRTSSDRLEEVWAVDAIPLMIDDPEHPPEGRTLDAVVDARMLKRGTDLRSLAPLSVALGPGFVAGDQCDAVIETMRGHNLGRVIWEGNAAPDTRTPGTLGGESTRRVLYSPASGEVRWFVEFGSLVEEGQVFGDVGGKPIRAPFRGVVRGMILPGMRVEEGTKIADVDPRTTGVEIFSLSDKARCVGRGVLEALLVVLR